MLTHARCDPTLETTRDTVVPLPLLFSSRLLLVPPQFP